MNMSKSEILEYIRALADKAHGEQVRKYTGERYIGHPVRVMKTVQEFNDDIAVLSAALLHDVVEDTPLSANELEHALAPVLDEKTASEAVELVVELTDIFVKESYPRMNRRSRKEKEAHRLSSVSPEAQTIKYADIIDNVTDIVKQDTDFAKVYVREAKKMLSVMTAGNKALHKRAVALVDDCLHKLQKPALY
jgi:guanosine-3',5'-bis(diphosphate) 3'-pyrophosphohydrolase